MLRDTQIQTIQDHIDRRDLLILGDILIMMDTILTVTGAVAFLPMEV